ncbi:hypothetical protein [Paenibacillus polymyxa]|uniref:hypothetical protein n=1 Tax=Paenibacillus polymyxa TaxID=1406 RepID=UPI002AB524AF|nr:hypothetical protein [Paenibacillus polymyxa]MDY8023406.1 hypothetical protein [Paenibacillus polymyxa]
MNAVSIIKNGRDDHIVIVWDVNELRGNSFTFTTQDPRIEVLLHHKEKYVSLVVSYKEIEFVVDLTLVFNQETIEYIIKYKNIVFTSAEYRRINEQFNAETYLIFNQYGSLNCRVSNEVADVLNMFIVMYG